MSLGVVLALAAAFGASTPLEGSAREACFRELSAHYARVHPSQKIGFGAPEVGYVGSDLRLTWSDNELVEARPDLNAVPLGDTAICIVKAFDRTIVSLTVNGASILSTEKKF